MIPVVLVYAGLAVGAAISEPLSMPVSGDEIPEAQEHIDYFPLRIPRRSRRKRCGHDRRRLGCNCHDPPPPAGDELILAGVGIAAVGSAVAGLGVVQTAAFLAISALLLYGGFTISSGKAFCAPSLPG